MLIGQDILDFNFAAQSTLWYACMYGRIKIAKLLLDDEQEHLLKDAELNRCLRRAVSLGQSEIVHKFVQNQRVNPGLDPSFSFRYYCAVGGILNMRAYYWT